MLDNPGVGVSETLLNILTFGVHITRAGRGHQSFGQCPKFCSFLWLSLVIFSYMIMSGISCIILSLGLLMVSSVIVVKKYKASGKTMEAEFEHEG